jgi:hypothetical protein
MENYEISENKIQITTVHNERVTLLKEDIVSTMKVEHPSRLGYALGILVFIFLGLIFIPVTTNFIFFITPPFIIFFIYKMNTFSKNILGLKTRTGVLYRIDLNEEDINDVVNKIWS